ncbi:MAG: membrane protein YqaA with SNARE-associated domain [Oleispira sp.]|jgi:membrane protein YqaA with SNARE-associated domain
MALIGLFFSALIAATLFPMGSEVVLIALLEQGHTIGLLWLIATFGNVLGSCINYVIGYWARGYITHKYQNARSWQQGQKLYNRYGVWSLLLAWLPIVGDPITLVAGLAKTDFKLFVLLVTIGKGARYAVLIALAQWTFN